MKSSSILAGLGFLGLSSFPLDLDVSEDTEPQNNREEPQNHIRDTPPIDITGLQDPPEQRNHSGDEYPPDAEYSRFLNVIDYGASGDGSADDTAAIQSTLDDTTDGDTIYFPRGEYLVGRYTEDESILKVPTDVENLTIRGFPGYGQSRLSVAEAQYRSHKNFGIFRVPLDRNPIAGLEIRDLTFDGKRPREAKEPSGRGVHCYPSGAGGGHDVLIEDCWAENFSGAAMVAREGGVTFNRITSVNNKQNYGLSEEDDSTAGTGEYGVVLKNSVSKNADWVGIDHNRGGRVRIANVYSENNGHSGLKTTHDNRQTRIENTTFQDERYSAAVRTNITTTADIPNPPIVLSLDTVAIRNANGGGLYLSGDDSTVQNSALLDGPLEIRNCGGSGGPGGSFGGLTVHSAAGGSIEELRVIGTENGPGVWFSGDHRFEIDTLYHYNNEGGPAVRNSPGGTLQVGTFIGYDPGRLQTPVESAVGAWSNE